MDVATPTGPAAVAEPPAWLAAAVDAGRVAAAISGLLPVSAGPRPHVRCEVIDARARGATWKVRYRVRFPGSPGGSVVLAGTLSPPSGGADVDGPAAGGAHTRARRTATASGDPGTRDWIASVPALGLELHTEPADRRLPAAAVLQDPEAARALLRTVLADELGGTGLAAATPRAVRYVYGSRCTVVYDLTYAADGTPPWPHGVVAKAYADGDGSRTDAGLRALWSAGLGGVVRIPRPLAYLPDVRVGLQTAVPGDRTVREVLVDAARTGDRAPAEGVLRRVADGLAALHTCEVADLPARTWADDADRVRRTLGRVAATWPAAAAALTPLLAELVERERGTSPERLRTAHGAFRPSQVLVDGRDVAFVDFDGLCLAEPSRDLGRFCTSLRKEVVAPPGADDATRAAATALVRALVEVLVGRYEQRAPLSRGRLAVWEALALVAGLAQGVATVRPAAVVPLLAVREDHGVAGRSGAVAGS